MFKFNYICCLFYLGSNMAFFVNDIIPREVRVIYGNDLFGQQRHHEGVP
jgi:hypothetical protein